MKKVLASIALVVSLVAFVAPALAAECVEEVTLRCPCGYTVTKTGVAPTSYEAQLRAYLSATYESEKHLCPMGF